MDLQAEGACRAILVAMGIAVAATSGCGGSHNSYPAPMVTFDAGQPDTSAVADAGTVAPPVVGPGSQRLLQGSASLVGSGPDSCTNNDPSTGDRWCAFASPSTFLGGTDLWVINVSSALRGKSIQCNVSDLDCLLLTSTLDDTNLPSHRFFGDTLIYYADQYTSPQGILVGPVYAWRPGKTAARKLTDNTGLGCTGHPLTDAISCYQNLDATTDPAKTTADLLAGKLSVGDAAPLPKIATVITSVAAETNLGLGIKYQAGLSPAGDWIAWSTRTAAAGVEVLSAQKLDDDTSRLVVAQDVARWSISRDSAKWYWLKSYNYSRTTPLGTLQMASFPSDPGGVAPVATTLRANVGSASGAGDKGLVYFGPFTSTGADLGLIADRDQAAASKTIDSLVVRLQGVAHDGRTVIYSKSGVTSDGTNFDYDLYAGGLDIATPCTLIATPDSPAGQISFSEPATTAIWSYFNSAGTELIGQYTTLATCHSDKFASNLWSWTPVKDQGVVFADTIAGTSATDLSATLRYAQFSGTTLPAAGTVVQERANPTFAVMLPALSAVVYTINSGGNTDGLYVKTGLPFPAP